MKKEFKVGDKVIALTDPENKNCQPRKKGQIYTVEAIMYCSSCGSQIINIGCKSKNDVFNCTCGNRQDNLSLCWTFSKYFAKVD